MQINALAERQKSIAAEPAPIRPGSVTLIVRDLAKVARFYQEIIGLRRLDDDGDVARLGVGGRPLLVLREHKAATLQPTGFAGLFHTALLLPGRADLGAWLAHALKERVVIDGASDHKVSEALYLSDPEGNGIEVYADRPRHTWKWIGDQVVMTTDPLDVRGLIAAGSAISDRGSQMPDGTSVGHIHLRVGGIPEAKRFYCDVLGFDVTNRRTGATFYATGDYHHHIATNTWHSRNAPRRSGTTTGLAALALLARDGLAFDAAAERLLTAGGRRRDTTIEAEDPWGNLVLLSQG